MGVKGLTYYVDNECSGVCRKVSIPELASRYPAEKPVLVVDGMCLINRMIEKENDWVYGGQWTEYMEKLKAFVNKFRQFGIELVLFYDGSVCRSKRTEWVARRRRRLSETDGVFYHIKTANRHPPEALFHLPAAMGSLSRFGFKYECDCEIRTSISEADQEISDYALKNPNCFAILSQDSDFFIYDTKPYLSLSNLDMDTLTTIMYDRCQLAREIGIDLSLFPLLSCLLGNDVVQVDRLRFFHRSLCRTSFRNPSITELIPSVVELIRKNGWTGQETQHIASVTNIDRDSLIQGMSVYSPCINTQGIASLVPRDPLSVARHMAIHGEGPCALYTLMCRQEYESSELLESRNDTVIKPSALIYREIRRRLYTVLFDSKRVTVKEWCAYHGNPLERPELVVPEELDYQGPKLTMRTLWCEPTLEEPQWELFRSCLGIRIPSSELRRVPNQFVALCCILNFLMMRPHLTGIAVWEVAAFICQAVSPFARDAGEIRKVRVSGVDSRAVQLAALFMRGVNHVDMVATVCIKLFPHYYHMPWHFFDGKLFHYYYLMARNGTTLRAMCENQEGAYRRLLELYRAVRSGTSFPETLPEDFFPITTVKGRVRYT